MSTTFAQAPTFVGCTHSERLESRAFSEWYLAGQRRRSLRCRGLAMPFDPTFPPSPGGGWERLPVSLCGPAELTLLGVPLRWVEYPALARSAQVQRQDPDAHYDGSAYYASDVNAYNGDRQIRI